MQANLELAPSTEADFSADEFGLLNYIRVISEQRWTILTILAVTLLGTLLITLQQHPEYEAKATLLIEPTAPRVLQNVAEVKDLGSSQDRSGYYQTQYHILNSDSLLGETMRRAHLSLPAGTDAASWLRHRLTIEPLRDSQLVSLRIRDRDPAQASMLANLIADVYIEQNVTHKLEATKSAVSWLEVQLEDLKTNLRQSELQLNDFKRDNGILSVTIEDRQSLVAQQLESLGRALNDTRIKRLGLEAELQGMANSKDAKLLDLSQVAINPAIQALLDKRSEAEAELAEISGRYLPGHPQYVRIKTKIDSIDQAMAERAGEISGSLQHELDSARRLESSLDRAISQIKQQALDLNQRAIDYNRIEREYETNKSLHAMVLTRLKETNLTGLLETNNVRMLDRAKEPTAAVSPNVPLDLALGALFGLVIGILAAFAIDRLDDSVKTQADLEHATGVAFLGLIPTTRNATKRPLGDELMRKVGFARDHLPAASSGDNERHDEPDMFVAENPTSLVSEYCRAIRSNLLFMSPDRPLRSMVVTSAEQGAGKTASAVKLATILAQTGERILIVDADMRRPRLHRVFSVSNEVGLSALISGGAKFEDAVKQTRIAGVDVVPSGFVPPNPAELIHSQRFVELFQEFRDRYRFVIFDSPPLLSVTDAMVLGKSADGVILIARANRTSRHGLVRVVEQLADVHIRIFGAILNDLDLDRRTRYYYREAGAYVRAYGASSSS